MDGYRPPRLSTMTLKSLDGVAHQALFPENRPEPLGRLERRSGPAGPVLIFGSLDQAKEQKPLMQGKPYRIIVTVLSQIRVLRRL